MGKRTGEIAVKSEYCAIERIGHENSTFGIGRVIRRVRHPDAIPIREAKIDRMLLTYIDYDRTWRAWCITHPLRQEQAKALLGREFASLDELRAAFPPLPKRPETAAEAVEQVIAGRK
jgi:hypothetical protein